MRLVMAARGPDGIPAAGVETGAGVVLVADLLGVDAPTTVAGVLRGGRDLLETLRTRAAKADPRVFIPAEEVRLCEPLGERTLVVAAGANYREHLREMGEDVPEKAAWFVKNSNCIVGPGAPIQLPVVAPDQVDWEAELCVVIGRTCHQVQAGAAWDHIAGFTLLNDVTDRVPFAALREASTPIEGRWAWTDVLIAKQYPTFGPLGPAVVTVDEIDDPESIRLTCTVNGETMQDTLLSDLAVGIPDLVEQFSRYFRFEPGDVISTGTPSGVGAGMKPPRFLKTGDTVTVAATGVGELTNPVVGPRF